MKRCLIVLAAVLASSGCSQKVAGRLPVVPVRGSASFQGQPLADAMLLFRPKDAGRANLYCYARTNAEGKFEVSTYEANDGAPEGEYGVTITWPVKSVEDGGYGEDRFQGRFNHADAAPFHVRVAAPITQLPPFEVPQ